MRGWGTAWTHGMRYELRSEKRRTGRATSHEQGIVPVLLEMEHAVGPPCEDFRGDYQILIDKTFYSSIAPRSLV
jgi:hypothetical protein